MGVYLVTNITDTSSDPKTIYIDDIPNRAPVSILPGRTVDLERISTRNQILDSLQLKVHFNEGRVTIDTLGTQPRERVFVDAEITTLDLGTSAALPLQSDKPEDSLHVSGHIGNFALAVRNDADGYMSRDGYYSPFQTDELGRLKVRTGFEDSLLTSDGYLKTAIAGLELGDLEINIESEYAEDSQHVSGHIGSFNLAVRNDTDTSLVNANLDYAPYQVDSIGRLKVRVGFEDSFISPDGYLEVASSQYGSWTVNSVQSGAWSVNVNNFPTTLDVSYGTVGSSTLRTAAQVGNATGSADFDAGNTTAQTLRVVLPLDQSPIPAYQDGIWSTRTQDGYGNLISSTGSSLDINVTNIVPVSQSGTWTVDQGTSPWVTRSTNLPTTVDTNYGAVGASTLRTAAQIGNATGAADFNAGTTTAQTLRVVLPTDQTAIPAAQSGTWTVQSVQDGVWSTRTQDGYGLAISSTGSSLDVNVTNSTLAVTQSGTWTVDQGTSPWIVESTNLPTTVDTSYGTVGASTLRTAAQIGNAAGAAEFGAGVTTAQTLRVVLPTDQTAIPAAQSGSWTVNSVQSGDWSTRTLDGYGLQIDSTGGSLNTHITNVVTVDQGTSPWVTQVTNLPTTVDTNYGVTTASTLRTAAQIGNSGGQADFNAGTTTSQTLRVVLPTDQTAIPAAQSGTWTVGLDPTLLDADGYLRVVNDLNIGDLEVNIEAEYAEDSQHVSGDVGSFVMAVRNDAESSLVDTNLDYAPFQVDSLGHLKVAAKQFGAWTVDQGTNPWVVDFDPSRLDADGYLKITLADVEFGDIEINVEAEYAEDSQHVSGHVGSFVMAVRNDAKTSLVNSDLDYAPFQVDSVGNLRVAAAQEGTWTVDQGTSPWVVDGTVLAAQDGVWSTRTLDGYGLAISSTGSSLDVNVTNTLAVTQSGSWTTNSSNLPTTVDTNYGAVGASTLRTAAQIGNATGAADFNAGTTTAQTLRVVLPTDQTAIPAAQSGTWTVDQGTNPWIIDFDAQRLDNDGYLRVSIAEIEFGDLEVNIESEYQEDSQHVSGDVGSHVLAVRNDVEGSLTNLDGDYASLQVDALGRLRTLATQGGVWSTRTLDGYGLQIDSTGGSLNTHITNVVTVDQGTNPWIIDFDAQRLDNDGYLKVAIAGVEFGDLEVNIESEYAEDSQHVSGHIGSFGLAVRNDAKTSLVDTDGDYAPFQVDSIGNLRVASTQEGTWTVQSVQSGAWTVTANQGTSPWVVRTTNLPTTVDTSYGTVGASTLRTAAQIGNASGAANFGGGITTGQTLRVVLPVDQTAIPVTQSGTWNIADITGTVSLPTGASTLAEQQSQTTTLTDIAASLDDIEAILEVVNHGNPASAQRVAAELGVGGTAVSGSNPVPVSQTGSWTVTANQGTSPWVTQVTNLPTTVDTNYGAVGASTLRTAAQIGNATGAADFNAGTTTAQTLRVVLPTDQTAIPAAQSGDWSTRTLDGYGLAISSTGSSLDVNVTNSTLAVTQSGAWTVDQGTNPWIVDFDAGRLNPDGYLQVAVSGIDFGDVEINVEAEHAEDSQHVSGHVGNFSLAVRRDADTSMVDADNDYAPFQVDSIGRLKVRTGFEDSFISPDGYLEVASSQYGDWTVTALQGTSPWVVDGTVLAAQDGTWSTRTLDGYGLQIDSTGGSLNAHITNVVPVSQSGTWNITDITGTVSLPTGASTLAEQQSQTTLLTTIDASLNDIESSLESLDRDFGTVGVDTLRTAAQLADGYGNEITSQTTSDSARRGLDTWTIKGIPEHFNSTVGTTPATITPAYTTTAILISNLPSNGSSDLIQVSFDGGTNYFDIIRGQSLTLECEVDSFDLKSNASGTAYQILVTHR